MASSKERLRLLNRQGHAPKLRDTITSNTTDGAVLKFDSSTTSWYADTAPGGAPIDAQYLVVTADPSLQNERVLTGGNGVSFADGGAGGNMTADLFFTGQTNGDVILRGPSAWTRVPQGATGQLFTVTETGITWADQSYGFPKHISEGAIATANDGVVVVCSFRFDPGNYPGISSFRFQVVLSCMRASQQSSASSRARLYNTSTGNYVNNSTLTTGNASPTTLTSTAISVSNSGDNFPTAGGVFELHLDITSPESGSMDTAILGYAGMIR